MTRAAFPDEKYPHLSATPGPNPTEEKVQRKTSFRYERRQLFTPPPQIWMPATILTAVLIGVFFWTIAKMWDRWHVSTGYYSHGPLVVPISLGMAWIIVRHKGLPLRSTRSSRAVGLVLLVGSLLVHLASMYARVIFVSGFTLLPILAAMVLYLGGWPALRRLWFPIAFLAFMVPLPDLTIYNVNFELKIFAAKMSTAVVNAIGIPAYLKGSEIFLQGGKQLTVEDACSGLRSLISLLAFASLFTYACRLRGYKRLLLLAAAVPVAVVANVVRIAVLTIVGNNYGLALATPGGWVHDTMGFAVFVIAFCILFLLEELLDALPGAKSGTWLGM